MEPEQQQGQNPTLKTYYEKCGFPGFQFLGKKFRRILLQR